MTDGITLALAQYATRTGFDHLPDSVAREATRAFLNVLGCAISGAHHRSVEVAARALLPFAGPPTATLIGRNQKTDPLSAALINATSASAFTFDDTHALAIVHPSSPVAPALLALCETHPVNGKAFCSAFTLGVEVISRLSMAVSVSPAHPSLAWVQTGIAGSVGAAVACARLLDLSLDQTVAAIGIAVSTATGLRIGTGTDIMAFKIGVAAQSGLRSALLASLGMTASTEALEEEFGFLQTFAQRANPSTLIERLGERHEILSLTYKLYPCGVVVSPVIDACLELRSKHRLDCAAIKRVRLYVNPTSAKLADRRHPETEAKAQISLQHWSAAVLRRGIADLRVVSRECIDDPEIRMLRDKIELKADDAWSREAARVEVEMQNGETLNSEVSTFRGSVTRPPSDEDLELKFRDIVAASELQIDVDPLVEILWNLAELPDVRVILAAAAGSNGRSRPIP